jgi:hypothetical protein
MIQRFMLIAPDTLLQRPDRASREAADMTFRQFEDMAPQTWQGRPNDVAQKASKR